MPPSVVPDPTEALAQRLREKARALAEQHDVDLAALRGRRIRVVRAVVYEGEATAVFDQLARSMPIGTAERRIAGQVADPRSMFMTVVQDRATVLVDVRDLEGHGDQLRTWQHAIAQLPPVISVTRFAANGVRGCPALELSDSGVPCYAHMSLTHARGDVEYIVRSELLPDAIYVSVASTDPRGIIGGMVDEIGKAVLQLVEQAVLRGYVPEKSNGP